MKTVNIRHSGCPWYGHVRSDAMNSRKALSDSPIPRPQIKQIRKRSLSGMITIAVMTLCFFVSLRPYHTFVLLEDEQKLVESLPIDSSPCLFRLIHVANPLKNLLSLACDADLSVQQVRCDISHYITNI